MTVSLRLAVLAAACCLCCPVRAADNWAEVKQGIESKYERVEFGPELTVAEVAAAMATGGKALAPWAAKTAEWLATVGYNVSAQTVSEVVFRGKSVPDVAGGVAAIEHWHMEKIPWIEQRGPFEFVPIMRDVKVPEPNSFRPWVGVRRRPPPAPVDPPGFKFAGNKLLDGEQAKFPPAVAVVDGRHHMVWVANNPDSDLLYAVSDDGLSWMRINSLKNEKSAGQPALVAYGKKLVLAFIAADEGKKLLFSVHDTTTGQWTPNAATGESSPFGPTLVVRDNKVYCYFVSNNPDRHILQCVLTPK